MRQEDCDAPRPAEPATVRLRFTTVRPLRCLVWIGVPYAFPMRILLVNPPHTAIGSRCVPDDHLPPLSLLALGGPLIDAGHQVELLDADLTNLAPELIIDEVCRRAPEAVLLGHSGSTSAHPTVVLLTRALRARLPQAKLVYGGVFPTYHWREVLEQEPQLDVLVRGEGEDTVVRLMAALAAGTELETVRGIAFRRLGAAFATPEAETSRATTTGARSARW